MAVDIVHDPPVLGTPTSGSVVVVGKLKAGTKDATVSLGFGSFDQATHKRRYRLRSRDAVHGFHVPMQWARLRLLTLGLDEVANRRAMLKVRARVCVCPSGAPAGGMCGHFMLSHTSPPPLCCFLTLPCRLQVGGQFRLMSPLTTFVVLRDLAHYVEHKVKPPASR